MRLLQILKKQFFRSKPQQANVKTSLNEITSKTMIERTFTKDDDTFMFI
ncbi:hypothetical protein ADIWIN_1548 [Winogradskyella psychrotolerans RS-3]|uniref:Uncharacterized protein n=1 Tax=Winogradskyella psychrotolerans RS-3 TaxID=641526 RepID=S7XBY1_9FLAO|nr:hypothetical protein [Winogradskyella psychrotolerans]EPR73518.1 hypothetical protein ADIWIN_1548 [Winogradskyella psychrotolerans RS-3]